MCFVTKFPESKMETDHNVMTEQTHEGQNTVSNDVAISVVMVVRNEELYIAEAIQSILDQTFKDFELIVVDDNSTDRTREIVNSFEDNRIHLHSNPNTPGKSGGLNHGYFLARGKYIANMDGDDISLPDRLQLQYDFMEENPNIGVVGGGHEEFGDENQQITNPTSHHDIFGCFLHIRICCANTVMRVSALPPHVLYRDEYNGAEDYKFFSELEPLVEFANIPEITYRYRQHIQQTTTKRRTLCRKIIRRVNSERFQLLAQQKGSSKEQGNDPHQDFVLFLSDETHCTGIKEVCSALRAVSSHSAENSRFIRKFVEREIERIHCNWGGDAPCRDVLTWIRYKLKHRLKVYSTKFRVH